MSIEAACRILLACYILALLIAALFLIVFVDDRGGRPKPT